MVKEGGEVMQLGARGEEGVEKPSDWGGRFLRHAVAPGRAEL